MERPAPSRSSIPGNEAQGDLQAQGPRHQESRSRELSWNFWGQRGGGGAEAGRPWGAGWTEAGRRGRAPLRSPPHGLCPVTHSWHLRWPWGCPGLGQRQPRWGQHRRDTGSPQGADCPGQAGGEPPSPPCPPCPPVSAHTGLGHRSSQGPGKENPHHTGRPGRDPADQKGLCQHHGAQTAGGRADPVLRDAGGASPAGHLGAGPLLTPAEPRCTVTPAGRCPLSAEARALDRAASATLGSPAARGPRVSDEVRSFASLLVPLVPPPCSVGLPLVGPTCSSGGSGREAGGTVAVGALFPGGTQQHKQGRTAGRGSQAGARDPRAKASGAPGESVLGPGSHPSFPVVAASLSLCRRPRCF